jgi:DNA-binding CsgD family transcriptional regulator
MQRPSSLLRRHFVVRGSELEDLSAAARTLQRGFAADVPAFAFIDGVAGVGKSRLVAELVRTLEPERPLVAYAQCFEELQAPYAPFVEAFAALARAAASPSSPWRHAAKNPLLAAAAPGDRPAQVETARLQRFAAASEFLRSASEQRPLLLVVEDVQWADDATLDLLRYLVRSFAGVRVFVVATARIDHDGQGAWRARLTDVRRDASVRVHLEPFTPGQMRQFLASDGEGPTRLAASDLERIEGLADGNPFVAGELVLDVRERPRDSRRELPATLNASVVARLHGLSEEDRAILSYAAVVGRRFDAVLLADVAGVALHRVEPSLRRAARLRLIDQAADETGYAFRHALTQEVLYQQIPGDEARALHATIAERMEAEGAGRADVATLAHHWSAAGDRERTLRYNAEAGAAAERVYAFRDAVRFYRRAVACAERSEERARLYERSASCFGLFGDLAGAREASRHALADYQEGSATERIISMLIGLSSIARSMGNIDEAWSYANEALSLATEHEIVAARFDVYQQLGGIAAYSSEPEAALRYLDEAARNVAGASAHDESKLHAVRAYALSALGRYREALDEYQLALTFARRTDDPLTLVRTLNNFGSRASLTGDLAPAIDAFNEAIGIATERNVERVARALVHNYASVQLTLGNLGRAKELYYQGLTYEGSAVATQVTTACLGMRIGLIAGDDELLERSDDAGLVERAFASREQQSIGNVAGTVLALYAHREQEVAARALRSRAIGVLSSTDFSFWLLDDVAARGAPDEIERARALLARDAQTHEHRTAAAYLLLFDARVAAREVPGDQATGLATKAIEAFGALEWPLETGWALEVARRHDEALATYRAMGAFGQVRRLERDLKRATARGLSDALSAREHEVAELVADGRTTRQIAERLAISERTVETHLQSIFRKLEVKSRIQLAAYMLSKRART